MRVKWAEIENGGKSHPGTFKAAWLAYRKAHFPKIAPRTRKDYDAESPPKAPRIMRLARFRSIGTARKTLYESDSAPEVWNVSYPIIDDESNPNEITIRVPYGYVEIGGFSSGKRLALAEKIAALLEEYAPPASAS